MKEITRIHIAKIAYDIEVDGKKDIEKYIGALERYASDPEILDDIEIRITELLAERGVAAGGVITKQDVAAVRAQLGEPSEFASEEVDGTLPLDETHEDRKRVYRDMDSAVLGGVLAGFARFFGIDPLWVRLLFIVVLFGSFGTALIIYLILWLIIPPAETVAEKLRMSGQPVTLASIKELAGNEEQRSRRALGVQRVLSFVAGLLLVVMAIGGILAIAAAVFGLGWTQFSPISDGWIYESWWFMTMMGLFVLSGLLFSTLCFLLASAAFHRRWTKRIGVAVVAIIASGLVVFACGVGAGMYGYAAEEAHVAELRKTTSGDLPLDFKNVKKLTFAADNSASTIGVIQYHVSDKTYYELEALPGVEPHFEITDGGTLATVSLARSDKGWRPYDADGRQTWRPWFSMNMPVLNVYGPALESVEVAKGRQRVSYESGRERQASLGVVIRDNAEFQLSGIYETVKVVGGSYASASLENAAISNLSVEGGAVTAGVVRRLSVTQPDVCAGYAMDSRDQRVQVRAVSGGTLVYNGKEMPAKTIVNSCGTVIIGSEDDMGEE